MKDIISFSILGDSISTFSGYIPKGFEPFYPKDGYEVNSPELTWWGLLRNNTNIKLLINDSWSGSRISKTGIEQPHSSAFISDQRLLILKGDIIIIFGGTNDFGQNEDQASLEVFKEAYRKLINKLIAKLPNSILLFCTPLQRTDYTLDQKNTKGWSQRELNIAIKEIIKKSGDKVKLVDLFDYKILPNDGILQDNLHPTCKGMRLIYSYIKKTIDLL